MFKLLIHWFLSALTVMIAAHFVPGFHVESFFIALITAAVLGLLNILVWPLLAALTFPITVLTLGLFLFVLNAIVLKFGAALVPGFTIDGFWPAIWGGFIMMLVGWLIRLIFGED